MALKYIGDAEHYVIHAWSCNFVTDLVVPLLQHFIGDASADAATRGQVLASTYVWLDCFCLPQTAGAPRALGSRLGAVHAALAQAQSALLLLDSSGAALGRAWCLYEVARAVATKGADALHVPVFEFPLDVVYQGIVGIDVRSAKAALPEDKDGLLAALAAAYAEASSAAAAGAGASPRLSPRLTGPLGAANRAIVAGIQVRGSRRRKEGRGQGQQGSKSLGYGACGA